MTDTIAQTISFVKGQSLSEGSHDWWHVYRVWQLSKKLAENEGADLFVTQLAALLHDIGDWKFHGGDETIGPAMARNWLMQQGVDAPTMEHVCQIIAGVSFKGAGVQTEMPTKEGKCVQDADRLDALGAIGIARCFAYGGSKGRPIYDPNIPPEQHNSFAAYQKNAGPSLNHFYEKLLLLKDRMQTESGRTMAEERHAFMVRYLEQFMAECNPQLKSA